MMKCKYCGQTVPSHARFHSCDETDRVYDVHDEATSFLISAAVGAVTDSAILGGLLGGNMLGGMLGDMLDGDLFD